MNTDVTISLAQISVVKGDLQANLAHHVTAIEQSSKNKADIVVFPELSLTGYELELVAELAVHPTASNFQELSLAAVENDIIVIAGCPLSVHGIAKPTIGAVICFLDGSVQFYSKQYLHSGENEYCSFGSVGYRFNVKGYEIALAICADFAAPEHSKQARESGADIYIVSALISNNGFDFDAGILSGIASRYDFPVLLSNHISVTGGWATCGKNSVWNSTGEHVFSSDSVDSCLVLCTIAGNMLEVTKV
ncbi:carbon-nitrogen hydrolase family protein [Marinomonas sp. 2405UD68-3]|uniref:carbon-nitrogen hydrolase family protein n=1 Tax=Marinomonas sp. 2405UD68-3 TaxID=3391835 RepID=UPI0039C9602B